MLNGAVSGNTASAPEDSGSAMGGGIYNTDNAIMMNGTISGNKTEGGNSSLGGGVFVFSEASTIFQMMNGSITDNSVTGTAENKKGPDVFALDLTKFVKTGGTVGTEPETSD